MAGGSFGGGNGSALTPYLVEDALDLNAIRSHLTDGLHYRQVSNIDMSTDYPSSWTPIASGPSAGSGWFRGHYDGNFKTISNLKNSLFNTLVPWNATVTSIVKDLFLSVAISVATSDVGGLARIVMPLANTALPDVVNCHITGSIVSTGSNVGGFYGKHITSGNATTQLFKSRYCSYDGYLQGANYVGGIVGLNGEPSTFSERKVFYPEDCKTSGNFVSGGACGGIIGYHNMLDTSAISAASCDCYAIRCICDATLTGAEVGGIVGPKGVSSLLIYRVEKCVALMPTITRSSGASTNFGRISAMASAQILLTNNRALDTMVFVP